MNKKEKIALILVSVVIFFINTYLFSSPFNFSKAESGENNYSIVFEKFYSSPINSSLPSEYRVLSTFSNNSTSSNFKSVKYFNYLIGSKLKLFRKEVFSIILFSNKISHYLYTIMVLRI